MANSLDSIDAARSAGIPVVECHRRAQRPGWACDAWIIQECPYCGERHTHGAGEGLRSSHCRMGSRGSYYLVKKQRVRK